MSDLAPTKTSSADELSIVDDGPVRPFKVEFPEDSIVDLRRRIARALGVKDARLKDHATIQYAKVAEYQTRGLIHFHGHLSGSD